MDCIGNTRELAIFETQAVHDLLEFKFKGQCGVLLKVGGAFHLFYFFLFSIFINEFYVYRVLTDKLWLLYGLMALCLFYPLVYELAQLNMQGRQVYFKDKWNYIDSFHIFGGFISIYLHSLENRDRMIDIVCKSLLVFLCSLLLMKTFFFMRLFKKLAHLVMMVF